ncbi:MAG: alkaline phosphatase [Verrucomicrobia bacterium]|nr:MAG: alkaline phosphatase [Verrucomicrobiota bacterium]
MMRLSGLGRKSLETGPPAESVPRRRRDRRRFRIGWRWAATCLFFTTALAFSQEGVRFAVIGDYGSGGKPGADSGDVANEKRVADLVKGWNPQFIITLGDNNYNSGDAETMEANVGRFYGSFISRTEEQNRFFPCLGNHDWRGGKDWHGKPEDVPLIKPYLDYFTLPGNERYYEFVRGPVHFFAIDSDPHEPDGTDVGSVQAQWLKERLAAATEPWKVVFFHEPPYTGGPRHHASANMRWPFKLWGASVVLTGHEHNYQHLRIEGLDFIVNGLGGGGRYTGTVEEVAGMIKHYSASYGAIRAEADNNKLVLRFITTSGELIESVILQKPPG